MGGWGLLSTIFTILHDELIDCVYLFHWQCTVRQGQDRERKRVIERRMKPVIQEKEVSIMCLCLDKTYEEGLIACHTHREVGL